jgi:Protein of unknown function (DUF1329)
MRISLTSIVVAMLAASNGGLAFGADSPANAERARSLPLEEHSTQTDLPPVLSKDNWQRAVGMLPAEFVDKIKSGELEVRTRATTDLPLTPAYVEATHRNAGKARLREDGSLEGYVNGRPFPEIDAADPQAGLKLAWNYRYHDSFNFGQGWGAQRFVDHGEIIRTVEFTYAQAYGMHRNDPKDNIWEREGILYKELFQALEPDDVKNLISLKFRYDDDRTSDLDFAYMRDMRKVRQTHVNLQERSLSSELLFEDYYCFEGYLHEHDWRFVGRAKLLAPVGVQAVTASFDPHTGYPTDPWELRNMLLLESTPKDPNHPYAKRVLYIDEQMDVPLYVLAYDHEGNHYKTIFTLYGNPAFNPGNEQVRAPLWLAFDAVNHETGRASFSEMHRIVVEDRVPETLFTIGNLPVLAR